MELLPIILLKFKTYVSESIPFAWEGQSFFVIYKIKGKMKNGYLTLMYSFSIWMTFKNFCYFSNNYLLNWTCDDGRNKYRNSRNQYFRQIIPLEKHEYVDSCKTHAIRLLLTRWANLPVPQHYGIETGECLLIKSCAVWSVSEKKYLVNRVQFL